MKTVQNVNQLEEKCSEIANVVKFHFNLKGPKSICDIHVAIQIIYIFVQFKKKIVKTSHTKYFAVQFRHCVDKWQTPVPLPTTLLLLPVSL